MRARFVHVHCGLIVLGQRSHGITFQEADHGAMARSRIVSFSTLDIMWYIYKIVGFKFDFSSNSLEFLKILLFTFLLKLNILGFL